jgi:hypothetical protein
MRWVPTRIALFDMATQRGRSAALDGTYDAALVPTERTVMGLAIGRRKVAEDVCHLEPGGARRCVANAWRSECGVIGLVMPQARCAFLQACSTALRVIGSPGLSPGNSQCVGRAALQHARKVSSSRGDNIT